MPADDGVRMHDNQRSPPVPPTSREGHPKESVACPEAATRRLVDGGQLLPKREVFQDQFPVAAERQGERADDHDQQFQHAVNRGWCRREIQLGPVLARDTSRGGRNRLQARELDPQNGGADWQIADLRMARGDNAEASAVLVAALADKKVDRPTFLVKLAERKSSDTITMGPDDTLLRRPLRDPTRQWPTTISA